MRLVRCVSHSQVFRRGFLGLSVAALLCAVGVPAIAQVTVDRQSSGVVVHNGTETLHLTVCGPDLIHVVAGRGDPTGASPHTPWIVTPCKPDTFDFQSDDKTATLKTSKLQVVIDLKTAALRFDDASGKELLREFANRVPRAYVPAEVNGEKIYHVSERFWGDPLEGLYGLGQHQSGVFDYRGAVVELAQANTNVSIPFLVSTKGYGLLWNTASRSLFDNRFFLEMKLTANAADAIDYYFVYGPDMDQIIHRYRDLTGHAPLFGRWAYGFVQSKDRYKSAKQLLDVAQEYRDQHVPLDFIVQDWFWWKYQGDPEYNEDYLKPWPDVPAALTRLHDEHVHAMISVWAKMDPRSQNWQAMQKLGLTIPDTDIYDATNPAARDYYWDHLMGVKFKEGWDGFWLDSSEPEIWDGFSDGALDTKQLHIGNGARYTNVFPLLHSGGVYEHWRQTTEKKRVFILTRSAFLGQQRNATTVWSGDVIGTWESFRRQIPAGLNFELSGLPYWTTDIAGYGWPDERDTRDPSYQELYTRWYEWGAFCPIFRTHGHRVNDTNEIFSYGPQAPTLIAYDKLRSRMLPYIYSLAWRVTNDDYTVMRPLVMDWPEDQTVRDIGNQYMFGPALLVNPVTEQGATSREVYLPAAAAWYDFWTGTQVKGEEHLQAPAPLDRIPLYIKAGSILPLGPEVEYAEQSPDAPVELRIYRGADGDFTLYNDEGDTYDYEKGEHATIPIHWDDASSTLTLGARVGSYPGMPPQRTFRVILVGPGHGAGAAVAATVDQEIQYAGQSVSVKLQ
ncbi:MAG TPA: TIM-barrel domain-containing protein [Acidobacteriaceae bacterium]|nr:TIM-barrel domain-containing protein [Acidobacteriaceae bacterium]